MTNNDNFQDISQYRDVEAINLYRTTVLEKGLATSNDMLDYLRVHSRDNARTPMHWGNQLYAGFSAHKPWLEVNPNYKTINAEAALENQNSIFYFYQQLIALRHKLPVITNGRFDLVANNETDDQIFAYTRQNSDMVLLIIANFTDKTVNRHFDLPKHYKCLIQNYHDDLLDIIRPYEVKVYQYAPNA